MNWDDITESSHPAFGPAETGLNGGTRRNGDVRDKGEHAT